MVRKILGFFTLIVVMAAALVVYSVTSSSSGKESELMRYVQKAKAETMEFASPVLKKLGVDVENISAQNANVVEKQLKEASDKVNEAIGTISK